MNDILNYLHNARELVGSDALLNVVDSGHGRIGIILDYEARGSTVGLNFKLNGENYNYAKEVIERIGYDMGFRTNH